MFCLVSSYQADMSLEGRHLCNGVRAGSGNDWDKFVGDMVKKCQTCVYRHNGICGQI